MITKLKESAVPFPIHTRRQIPAAFKDQVREELNYMISLLILSLIGVIYLYL